MSSLLFSSSETECLHKSVLDSEITKTPSELIDYRYEINTCSSWIKANGFKNVCLQFPDHLLPDATEVALKLQYKLRQTVYILGDTSYESCCVDYVTAAHADADAIIHFGPICFSQSTGTIPFLNVYEKLCLDLNVLHDILHHAVEETKDEDNVFLLLDTSYYYLHNEITAQLSNLNIRIALIDEKSLELNDSIVFFIGDKRKLPNIKLIFQVKCLYYVSSMNGQKLLKYEDDTRILKRRRFLVEKIKDCQTVGIIIGTLAVKNYLRVIERMKKLLRVYKKKYYIISVGKPTIAKLANFPEVDLYVLVTCSMSELYDSRDFYKPIATPYDLEIALNPESDVTKFSLDFNSFLPENDTEEFRVRDNCDVSLLTGSLRVVNSEHNDSHSALDKGEIVLKNDGVIALNSNYGNGYLNSKSWKGLEPNLGHTQVSEVEEGRKGIAQGYDSETLQ